MTVATTHDTGSLRTSTEAALRTLWSDPSVAIESMAAYGDGHSGFTYLVTLSSRAETGTFVARLSPPGARIAGPSDVGRQARVMSALYEAGLPAPRIIAADSTGLVQDRSLAVMQQLTGASWEVVADSHGHRFVAASAVDLLRRIWDLPLGLVGVGADVPYSLEDEVRRWLRLARSCPAWLQEPAEILAEELLASLPAPAVPGLVHGDYHYGNLLFDDDGIVGVFDWEIACLGDSRLDFGCLGVASLRRRYRPEPNPTGDVEIALSDLAALYGLDATTAAWFISATCLKYLAILGYNLGLHRRGKRTDPIYEQLLDTMHRLGTDGRLILAEGLGEF